MNLSFRINRREDKDQLLDLWKKYSGWDDIAIEAWEDRFEKGPVGPAPITIIYDRYTGKVMGQFIFIPSLVSISGAEHKACRPFAPIIHPDLRNRGMKSMQMLFFKSYLKGIEHLKSNSYALVHMNPDPRWMWLLSKMPFFQTASFPLYSKKLPTAESLTLSKNSSLQTIDAHDKRIDDLWMRASKLHSAMIVRDTRMLPWKLSHGDYRLHGIIQNSRLIGMFATVPKNQDKQYLICDLLSENLDDALNETLCGATIVARDYIIQQSSEAESIHKVAILAYPKMMPALEKLGYSADKYNFPMVIHRLNKNIPKMDIEPKNWYVSAND